MTAIFGLLTSRLGAIGAWALVVGLGFMLVLAKVETSGVKRERDRAVKTGAAWQASSKQWELNYLTVFGALDRQSAAVRQLGEDRRTWEADAQAKVRAANVETERAETKYSALLRRPFKAAAGGSCPRVDEVAADVTEDMR